MSPGSRIKAYSYIRFSTPEQERGDSLRRQAEAAACYASRHDLELMEDSYQDLGISAYHGSNAETGMLAEFMDAVRSRIIPRGSYLLIESMDRLSRAKPRKAIRILESICDEGIIVVTLADGKVYDEETLNNDPMVFMWAFMVAIRANEESAIKSRRLRAAWANKRTHANETILTAKCPSWLKLVGAGAARRFEIIEAKAAVVRRIYKMSLKGIGQNRIAEVLNEQHVPPFNDGTMWHRSFVARLLKSETVIGVYYPHILDPTEKSRKNRKRIGRVENYYPPVVSKRDFVDVQTLREARTQCGQQPRATMRNVLAGLGKCAICGGTVSLVSKSSKYRYIVCARALAGAGCRYICIRHELVCAALMRDGLHWQPPFQVYTKLDEQIIAQEADANLAAATTALDNLVKAIETGHESVTLWDRMRKAEKAKEDAATAVDRLRFEGSSISGAMLKSRLARLKAARGQLNVGAANASLRILLHHVVVHPETRLLELHWRHGAYTELTYV